MADNVDILAVERLTREIRAVIRAAFERDLSDAEIATALMYELASCIAFSHTGDLDTTLRAVDKSTAVMKQQILAFASRREHP